MTCHYQKHQVEHPQLPVTGLHPETIAMDRGNPIEARRWALLAMKTRIYLNSALTYPGPFSDNVEDLEVALKKVRHRLRKAMGL